MTATATPNYSHIVLPPDLQWYDALGGQEKGWACEVNGPGWWHLEELNLEAAAVPTPNTSRAAGRAE